ncbi:SRPBCC family protein [Amycolatopsis sp. H20-H5]|uniref:SRPBCC family protein n=1 Tax=Amycolatopsis sp. H20-H5 TaxID=3046309 RepID=UPI002DB85456|nr:SRPBCC family protein [Amycolatopsis sp. H20-H5]MEC3974136.1 SRPBCC family protein [Amycolatopsis sp. H20-H5]
MKYSDCPEHEVQIRIAAPPATVWPWVLDIGLPARFSTEFDGAEWVGCTEPSVGAKFVGHNTHPAFGSWETTSFVTGLEPERLFAWAVSDVDRPSSSWRFELTSDGEGTILRQGVRIGPARSGLSFAIDKMPEKEERIVERRIREFQTNMLATVEGIKSLAEADET